MPRFSFLFACLFPLYGGWVTQPSLGVIFDEENARLRLVKGIAGAARLQDFPDRFAIAAVSPASKLVLAVGADGKPVLLRNLGDRLDPTELPELPSDPASIVWSPTGTAALLYYPQFSRALTLKGFPGRTFISGGFDVPGMDCRARFSLSDGAANSLAVCADRVIQLSTDLPPRHIGGIVHAVGAAFLEGSETSIIADRGAKSLLRLSPDGGITVLINDIAGLAGVAGSARRIIAVFDEGIALFGSEGDRETVLPCACSPALVRAIGPGTFQITTASDSAPWFLDFAGGFPRLSFASAPSGPKAALTYHRSAATTGADRLLVDLPGELPVLHQAPVLIRLDAPASRNLRGRLSLSFEPDSEASGDQTIQLSSGTYEADFEIPVGQQEARFRGSPLVLQTGDRPGRIRLAAELDDPMESGSGVREANVRMAAPLITRVRIATPSGEAITLNTREFEVHVDGAASGDLASLLFRFTPSRAGGLTVTDFPVDVRAEYAAGNRPASFRVIVQSSVKGSLLDIASGAVRLINQANEMSQEVTATPEFLPAK
jgi:hypothetical protein